MDEEGDIPDEMVKVLGGEFSLNIPGLDHLAATNVLRLIYSYQRQAIHPIRLLFIFQALTPSITARVNHCQHESLILY